MYDIQGRHNLKIKASSSDRKMTDDEYLRVRPRYLKFERNFRRSINVIVPRPDNYSDEHEEIWDDDVMEIWDATREFNIDEVPLQLELRAKQIMGLKERASVVLKGIWKFLGKYRQGTLVIVTNYVGVLFIVIIYKGGPGVTKKLVETMQGTLGGHVFWVCSESGSMTASIWKQTMNWFQNYTKKLRGCVQINGMDWKKSVVLNVDNYGVHLNDDVAHDYATAYGIFIRCLLRNASQHQQPVDQHVGVLVKKMIKKNLEDWLLSLSDYESYGMTLQYDVHKWRSLICCIYNPYT